jgi:tetratricopeptide (TPR) repeat protein
MLKILFVISLNSLLFFSCLSQNQETQTITKEKSQEQIIEKYFRNIALKYSLYSREREEAIDQGLTEDSTIAYLWQQKAMPLFKQGKYELGMKSLDKAVIYKKDRYQGYRGFIKCIFAKTYREAIIDLEDCKLRYGNNYEMDHTYNFYIALSHLQLNEFEIAEQIFKEDIESLEKEKGIDWVHHLDLFYYGITKYEQKKYKEAVTIFEIALKKYPEFSDAQYYYAICLARTDHQEKAQNVLDEAKVNAENGYTINEDNAIYERYPYQIRW